MSKNHSFIYFPQFSSYLQQDHSNRSANIWIPLLEILIQGETLVSAFWKKYIKVIPQCSSQAVYDEKKAIVTNWQAYGSLFEILTVTFTHTSCI